MMPRILRLCMSISLTILTYGAAQAFSLPSLKPTCEIVDLAEVVVVGQQTKCSIPHIDGPEPPGGLNAIVEFEVYETLFGPTFQRGQVITVSAYCLEQKRTYVLILRNPIDGHRYLRAYGLNDILPEERKEEVVECIKKNQAL